MYLVALALQIPAQAIVESQLARDLPGVLKKESPCLLPPLRILHGVHSRAIDETQQEARVRESNAAAAHIRVLKIRQTRLVGKEVQDALRSPRIAIGPTVQPPFTAEFVSVAAADITQCRVAGKSIVEITI